MNTKFNTIETIRTDSKISNKTEAYLLACDSFEVEASKFANNENFVSRKSAEEVSLNYAKAKTGDCEYAVYAACYDSEKWLEKAWNNAD